MSYFLKIINWLLNWVRVSDGIIPVLLFGWCWFVLSCICQFEIPSSGAVLVCTAVMADALLSRWSFRNHDIRSINYGQKSKKPNETAMYALRRKNDPVRTAEAFVVPRVELGLIVGISFNAFAGTLIWGYGSWAIKLLASES